MEPASIIIRGARQHNLKNLSLTIPRNQLVVITGLSGSGKSSLAFDTLFAEGQRRYMESLSAYARQFLDQMQKPDVDHIEGLSPAIAIEQRTAATNPRSTIATTTEIFDFLRLLYSSIGKPHHPVSGHLLKRYTRQEIVDEVLRLEGKVMVLAPLISKQKGEFRDVLEKLRKEGFIRARIDGEIQEIEKLNKLEKNQLHTIEAVVDRLVVSEAIRNRLSDSIETALEKGCGLITVLWQTKNSESWQEKTYSINYFDPLTGEAFEKLTPRHFSFNSPLGACPRCHGLGTLPVLDEKLVIRDPTLSLEKGVIAPWRHGHRRLIIYYKALLRAVARHYNAPLDKPWQDLDSDFQRIIFYGSGEEKIAFTHGKAGKVVKVEKVFEGVIPQLKRLHEETESQFTRSKIERYMSRQPCLACKGARFKPEILAVTLGGPYCSETKNQKSAKVVGKNIHDICELTIHEAKQFLAQLQTQLSDTEQKMSHEIFREILQRLQFLEDVGLSYLTLNRESGTLSGGEAQRIRLATQVGSGLTSVLYILDEPSIGLHQSDNERLLTTLKKLRDLGNSVIVVEHDEDTILAADHVMDLGPAAGARGGYLVAQGTPQDIFNHPTSSTGHFLRGERAVPIPRRRELGHGTFLTLQGARANNLKNLTVRFPLGTLTCVTGVSGSGKSSLVNDILSRALFRHFYGSNEIPGEYDQLVGLEEIDKVIEINQSSLGRHSRSNPVTYIGVFNEIRNLFAGLPLSRVRGYSSGRFSFNVKGGRCEHCQGDGTIQIPMHFLPDVYVMCEICLGKRFNRETLEVTYRGKTISDVLEMSVDEACDFFRNIPKIKDKLECLSQVGVGYLKLGQSADTLSGGEAQRVKLSAELAKKQTGRTIYLLDEPTTGLHFADVELLIKVLLRLRDSGNTLIVIEHNLDVIKCADHVIDLGPGGGVQGGHIVAQGTPEKIAGNARSLTGKYLAKVLKKVSI
ncbi:MAG: excinuclease ABC subunit UvrA [Verrucomicrobiia bacterium]